LTSGVTYYWRVRARFGDAATPAPGAFSLVRNFKFDNVAPNAPLLTAPANKAILAAVRPTLAWAAVTGATSYRLDVDDDPNNDGVYFLTLIKMTECTCQLHSRHRLAQALLLAGEGSRCSRQYREQLAAASASSYWRTVRLLHG
jgi:hypothetical protein